MTNIPPHILVVDDNPINIKLLSALLAPYNYQITVAMNGEDALKAVESHRPDLILLDVMMPDIDGFEVCRRLKADSKTQHIEVIFVTAAVAPDEELKGIDLGAVDYIHKPYSVPIVQAKVALHLERAGRKKELELKNAALAEVIKLREEVDLIARHDMSTPLTHIEFYSRLLLNDENLSVKSRLNLETLLKAGVDVLSAISHSLDMFKMETGRYYCHPVSVDIVSIINRISEDIQSLIAAKNIALLIKVKVAGKYVKAEQFIVLAEANLCYLLFTHLLRDTIEACNLNDIVVVSMYYENNKGVIHITNPETIPEHILATFFEKQKEIPLSERDPERGVFDDYIAAKQAKGRRQGAYLAKLMTTTQNGSIDVTANERETCITVRLPN